MIPYAIDHPYQRPPWATIGLIAAKTVIYLLTVAAPEGARDPFLLWSDRFALWQWFSAGFLHADTFHLAGNMLFLWI